MDIWGVGCVFFEVMALFPLFPGNNELDQVHRIHKVLGTPDASVLAELEKKATHMKFNFPPVEGTGFERHVMHVSAAGRDLIGKMLAYKCDDRISARQALKHVYFKEFALVDKPLRVFPSPVGVTDDSAGEDEKTDLVLPVIKTSKRSEGNLKMVKSYKTFSNKIPSITKKIVLENRKINLSPVKKTL
jgi:renal tumor antigen